MARLVLVLGTAHAPGQSSLPDLPAAWVREAVARAWDSLAARLREAQPDLIIGIANDHFQNFAEIVPSFCVGTGESHRLPDDAYAERLKLVSVDWPGAPSAAESLLRTAELSGMPLAFSDRLSFVDEFALPLHFMKADLHCKLLPILTNCLHRHRAEARTFLRFGEMVASAVTSMDAQRVAIVATGGLSHDPFGPEWGLIDQTFDRRFLELIESNDREALLREISSERINAAGIGGTPEVLNWFCAVGAASKTNRPKLYGYVPASEWSTGLGYVEWAPADVGGDSESALRL